MPFILFPPAQQFTQTTWSALLLFYFLTVSNVFPSLLPGVIQTPVRFNRLSSVQLQSNTIDVKDTLASLIASKYVTDIDLNSNEYW